MGVSIYNTLRKQTKYSMLKRSVASKICDTFYKHKECVNENYEKFRSNEWISSDRDRFVDKFFKKYVGKYFILINKEVVAVRMGTSLISCEPYSIYTSDKDKYVNNNFMAHSPYYRVTRKYLRINGFQSVNEPYGRGFILMLCSDYIGDRFDIKLDYNNLTNMQFKEITEGEFNAITELFSDNRIAVPFNVTRFLDIKEIQKRRLKKDEPLKETIIVKAKDSDDAKKKASNVLEVKCVEQGD